VSVLRLILRRVGLLVPLLLGVTLVVFLIVQLLPGDPATAVLGVYATKAQRATFAHEHGLDDPLPVRYARFVGDLAHGDLGVSAVSGDDVAHAVAQALPMTLQLTAVALVLAAAISLLAGVASAVTRGGRTDALLRALSVAGLAAPSFWIALLLIQVFALQLKLAPAGGYAPPSAGVGPWLQSLALPALALALPVAAGLTRVVRASVVEELDKDYVRTARGLGLPPRVVVGRNVLRNALITPMTVMGLRVGYLLSGSVIVESIFALPGIGRLLITAVNNADLALIQGIVLFATAAFIVVNLAVDVLYILLNPRLRTA
jgi:peptide/nickel transport system permease protein